MRVEDAGRVTNIGKFALWALALAACVAAHGTGVSGYLPLQLEPEAERQVERLMILADQAILKRPFSVAAVEKALALACGGNEAVDESPDESVCESVRGYLARYAGSSGLTHASASVAGASGADSLIANKHGLVASDTWSASGAGYWQPNEHFRVNLGAVGYSGRIVPTGSYLSAGFDWAQLDVGFRDHWSGPATDSSMLISSEAPTMPSVTLSNSAPLSKFGIQYELSLARMSTSERILRGARTSSGHPLRYAMHLSMEPVAGWSLGINRVLQFGGGVTPSPLRYLLHNILATHNQADVNGQASYVSRFLLPGRTPIAVYFEYGGEDTSNGGSYLLGNAALTVGIDVPRLWHNFDLTFETSEWQNAWYVHTVYLDGMTNEGIVLGHWGGDQRRFGDGVGARTAMLRLGWAAPSGGYWEGRIRTLSNQNYSGFAYAQGYDATLRYSQPWRQLTLGAEIQVGRDVFGASQSRLTGFVRYGVTKRLRTNAVDGIERTAHAPDHEYFFDAGFNANKVRSDIAVELPPTSTARQLAPHLAFCARRAVSAKNDFGARLELDKIAGHSLIGVRALDYRHRFGNPLAISAFLGAARYDLATPAYSIYGGVGGQWRNILPGYDLGLDLRYAQNVARDRLLPGEPQGVRPDSFYKIASATFFVSKRF